VDATPCPAEDGSSPARRKFNQPPPMCIDPSKRYTATMDTSMGSLTIALDPAAAPMTVNLIGVDMETPWDYWVACTPRARHE